MRLKQCIFALVAMLLCAFSANAQSDGVAKIGSTTYATFAEALTAASAMSGDVTVEVYDKVTLNTAFSGSYSSINFVGKDTDAEIYLDVQGYITATVKKVSFTDLKLSKSAGGYMTNAGFMNVAFGIYDVTEVAYTKCVFANGAYASSGNVTFNGCTFYRSHDKYGLWAYGNVDVAVEGCTFADYRGIKMYAEGAAKTVDLTVKDTDFSAVNDKPAIVLTYGESVALEGNTYSSTGTFELDKDGDPNGTSVTSDVAPTCMNDDYPACGVLVDGKIYTTVTQAAEVAAEGSNVTLLYSTNDAVEFAEGVNLTLASGVTADNVTVATSGVVVAKIGGVEYTSLQAALDAAAAGTGNVTVEILADVNLTGIDWNPVTVSATGYPVVTVEGGYHTITGLNDMLFHSTWAGKSGLIIKNLTIANSAIVNDKDDAKGNVGVGAFIGYPQASATITLENCHLENSSVEGGHWTGGLIGMAGGYNGEDGPVFMNLTIKGCSVTGSTITGKGSVGGVIGHGSCSAWTNVVIEETTVEGNTITSTGSSTNKAGAVMGTIGAAGQPATANGVTKTGGASVSATVAGNNVTSNTTVITTIYGRQGTPTGQLCVAGGSYDKYPIEQGVAYAAPVEGYKIEQNTDGTYGIVVDPAYGKVAMIGETYYETLDAAFAAVQDGETITLIDNVTVSVATAAYNDGTYIDGVRYTGDKSFTVDFNGKTVTDDGCVNDYLIYINNKGEKASEITFTNGTIVSKNGCWSAVCVNSSAATQNVVLNLNGMNITNSNDAEYSGNPVVRVRNLATVNVNDKTVITSNGASYGVAANTDGSTLNINEGATIVQQNSGTTGGNSVFAAVGGKGVINIKGGTITSDKYGVHTMTTGTPVINISGGTITAPVALKSSTNGGNGELATINVTGGTINGTLETYTENGKIVVSGGTFSEAVAQEYCADGYAALPNLDGKFVIGAQPTATVNNLGMTTVAAGDYSIWNGSFDQNTEDDGDMPLSFVMQFLADQDAEDMETSPYADWYGDFVITFTGLENGSFTADGCYLAGHYGSFGWVKVPVDGMTIEDGARYPVMLGVGLGQKYDYICSSVEDFKCALYLTPEILEANPNIQVKLELGVVDNSKGSDAAANALVKNENVYSVTDYTYDAEDFVVDPNYIAELTIDDAEGLKYDNTVEKTVGTLTYKRTFAMGVWNPLYVPFEVSVDALVENYEIAYYNQMLSYDNDNDGVFETFDMEIAKLTTGTVIANYPLFIKPRTEDACSMEYVLEDATLYAAKEYFLETSSASNIFKFHATYQGKSKADLEGYLTVGMSGWTTPAADLKPGRMYLQILKNNNSPFPTSPAKSVRFVVNGEDGTTGVEEITGENGEEMIFDLQGRRVLEPEKGGLYIINGKKVLVK